MLRIGRKGGHVIAQVPLFAKCSPRDLEKIDGLLTEVDIPVGEVLCREGAPGRECFLIREGTAKATLRGRTLATLGPGAVVGEMALLDGGPRSATITAETPMRVFVLDPGAFSTLLEDVPAIARNVMRGLSERLRAVEKAPA